MRSPGSRARTSASVVIAVIAVAAALAAAPLADAAAARAALPARSNAPYFETWTKDQLPAVARQSGSRYFTLAFLQTPRKDSCVLSWNGDPGQTVAGSRFLQQITRLRAMGGEPRCRDQLLEQWAGRTGRRV